MHSPESLLPDQRTNDSTEKAKDEAESDRRESLPYEYSEGSEESSISELVSINIDW